MEHADGHAGRAQGRDDRALVDARGLADHMDGPAVGGDPGGQGVVAGGIIGEGETRAGEMPGEGGFGHIKAEIDERWSHGVLGFLRVGVFELCLVMRTRPANDGSGNSFEQNTRKPRSDPDEDAQPMAVRE